MRHSNFVMTKIELGLKYFQKERKYHKKNKTKKQKTKKKTNPKTKHINALKREKFNILLHVVC